MMTQRSCYRPFLASLIITALLAVAPAPSAAAAEPKSSTPRTYHYQANLVIAIARLAISGEATGDFDVANGAFHTKAVVGIGEQSSIVELILVGDRLYIYNQERARWEYEIVPPELRGVIVPGPKVPPHPTAAYRALGDETISTGAARHWQAKGDYNTVIARRRW